MINRELIRIKIVQLVYAYYQSSDKSVSAARKELSYSMSKAYDMYHELLLLMVDLTDRERHRLEAETEQAELLHRSLEPNRKFVDNKFIAQLSENKQLEAFRKERGTNWNEEDAFMRNLLATICDSDIYRLYMATPAPDYEADRELWRKLYKTYICENDDLDAIFEEACLYWNDDKVIVDSFVLKTIKRFDPANGADQPLLPEFDSDEDRQFADQLLTVTLEHDDEYRDLIRQNCKNWEFDRLAFMDVIIMQTALAEIINFPLIPLNVSFNEYLNIAKLYSTPRSARYINGVLDHAVKALRSEGQLFKR